jgi:hypothetical protein
MFSHVLKASLNCTFVIFAILINRKDKSLFKRIRYKVVEMQNRAKNFIWTFSFKVLN